MSKTAKSKVSFLQKLPHSPLSHRHRTVAHHVKARSSVHKASSSWSHGIPSWLCCWSRLFVMVLQLFKEFFPPLQPFAQDRSSFMLVVVCRLELATKTSEGMMQRTVLVSLCRFTLNLYTRHNTVRQIQFSWQPQDPDTSLQRISLHCSRF